MGNARTFGKAYHIAGEEWMTWNRCHQSVAETLGGPTPTPVHIPTDLLVRLRRSVRAGVWRTSSSTISFIPQRRGATWISAEMLTVDRAQAVGLVLEAW